MHGLVNTGGRLAVITGGLMGMAFASRVLAVQKDERVEDQALQTESAAVESDTAAAADSTLSPIDRSANRDAHDQS